MILAGQPDANWFQRHITSWSSTIAIDGLVDDLRSMLPVLAFGVGLVFGFTFDTTGPRRPGESLWEASVPAQQAPPPEEPAEQPAAPVETPDEVGDRETERIGAR